MSVRGRFRPSGFTLVEILVVVFLMAIATAASLAYLRPPAPDVSREGRRLAVLLDRLSLEARLSGTRTAWRCDGVTLVFESWQNDVVANGGAWRPWPARQATTLAEGLRLGELTINGEPAACVRRIVFPAFGIGPEFSLAVSGEGIDTHPERDGLYRVVGDASGHVAWRDMSHQ